MRLLLLCETQLGMLRSMCAAHVPALLSILGKKMRNCARKQAEHTQLLCVFTGWVSHSGRKPSTKAWQQHATTLLCKYTDVHANKLILMLPCAHRMEPRRRWWPTTTASQQHTMRLSTGLSTCRASRWVEAVPSWCPSLIQSALLRCVFFKEHLQNQQVCGGWCILKYLILHT